MQTAPKTSPTPPPRRLSPTAALVGVFKNYFLTIFITIIVALLVRVYAFEAFRIPTDYMAPTLLSGDHIFVHKLFKTVRRGDLVVFSFPNDPRKDYIKRVVGVAGDTIEIRQGRIVLNGSDISQMRESFRATADESEIQYFEEKLGDRKYTVQWMNSESQKMIEVKVPEGHVFVLGDNRFRGQDSRVWGFLPADFVKGKALFIWLSVGEKMRWNRFFKGV